MTPTTSSPSSAQKRKIKTIDNVRYHLQIFEFCAALCERGASGAIDENASRELIQWVRDEYKSLNSAMVERTLRFIAANEECSFKNVRWKISKEASRVIERELAGVPILYCTALVASRNDAPCASPAKKEFGYKFCGRHAPRCEFSEESGNRCTYKAIFGRKCCERHKIFEEDMAREPEPKEVSSDEREGKTLCKLCNRSCGKNSTKYGKQFCNVHIRLTENYEFSDHFKFEKFRPSEKNPILETRIRELDEFALATFQLKKVPKNFRKKVLDLLNIKKMSYQDVDLTVYSQGVVLAYPNPEEHQKGKSYEKYAFGAETSIKQLRASSEKFSLKFGNVVKYFYCESETVRKEVVHLITRLTDKNASDETKNAVRKPKNYTDWLNPIRERAQHLNEKKDKDKKRAQILHDLFERNLPMVKEAKGEGEGEEGEEKGEQHEEYSWYDKELTIETTTSEGKEIKEYWWGVARNERSGRRIGTEEDFGKFKKQLNEILKLPVEIGVSKAVDGTEGGKGDERRNNGGGGGGGGDDDADDGDGDVGGSNYYELKWLDDIEKIANDEKCAVNCQDAQSRRDRVEYLTNELFTGEQLLKPLNSMQNEKDLYYYWKPHQKIGTSEEHLVEFSKRLDTMFPSYFVGRKRGDSTTLSGTYIHEEQNRPPWKDSPKQCWKLLCDKNYRNKGLLAEKWEDNAYLKDMKIPAELDDSTDFAEYTKGTQKGEEICKFRVDMYGNVVQHPDIGDSSTLCSTEVDHVLPWSRGGLSTPKSGNIQLISWFANRRKSNKFLHGPLYVNGWGKENSEEERLDVGISVELFISLFECVATLYYDPENASKKKNRLRGAKLLQSPYGKLVMTLLTKRTFITKPPKILDDANDATCLPDEKPIGDTIKILNKAKGKNATNNYQGYYLLEELLSKAMFARGFEKEDEQAEIRRIYNHVREKKAVLEEKL